MKRYIVMPEKCRFYTVDAMTAENAYCAIACWYDPKKPVAIMDAESGKTVIFTRQLDGDGNLIKTSTAKAATE